MHINYLRDIPLALGILAILIALTRRGNPIVPCDTPDGENPQWLCKVVLNFVGVCLIGFAILAQHSPH